MKAACVLLLAFAAVALAVGPTQFDDFIAKYNKNYTTAEYEIRLEYFLDNVARLNAQKARMVAAEQNTWEAGITQFFDLSPKEFALYTGGRKYEAAAMATSCLAHGVTAPRNIAAANVTAFNWVTEGKVNAIKDQGQCGSCWAFSTISVIESAWAIKNGTLKSFSEQEIVDCSHGCSEEPPYGSVCNQGCNGGWPWNAFSDIVAWKGVTLESEYPYTAETGTCKKVKEPINPITNYTCLSQTQGKIADEAAMADFLVANGPLSIAMDAGILQTYTSGIIKPGPSDCSQVQLDHAIVIVGFGTDATAGDFWIVRNSWGVSWGEKGYFRIVRGVNACGLASAVSHPIV